MSKRHLFAIALIDKLVNSQNYNFIVIWTVKADEDMQRATVSKSHIICLYSQNECPKIIGFL